MIFWFHDGRPMVFELMTLGDWLLIAAGVGYICIVFRVDRWLVESGNRIEPADYIGLEPPTPGIKRQVSGQDKDK